LLLALYLANHEASHAFHLKLADLYTGAYYGPTQGSCHIEFASFAKNLSEFSLSLGGQLASLEFVA
jgi:hypothetical protein